MDDNWLENNFPNDLNFKIKNDLLETKIPLVTQASYEFNSELLQKTTTPPGQWQNHQQQNELYHQIYQHQQYKKRQLHQQQSNQYKQDIILYRHEQHCQQTNQQVQQQFQVQNQQKYQQLPSPQENQQLKHQQQLNRYEQEYIHNQHQRLYQPNQQQQNQLIQLQLHNQQKIQQLQSLQQNQQLHHQSNQYKQEYIDDQHQRHCQMNPEEHIQKIKQFLLNNQQLHLQQNQQLHQHHKEQLQNQQQYQQLQNQKQKQQLQNLCLNQKEQNYKEINRTEEFKIKSNKTLPYIKIIEQPAKVVRFRYASESRSAPITGINSTMTHRTYPTVKIVGYKGKGDITVVVSSVMVDKPYRAHPYKLINIEKGQKFCKNGICQKKVPLDSMTVGFNMSIQSAKKRDLLGLLTLKEHYKIDPFKAGFEHKKKIDMKDMASLRLCFQAFVKDGPITYALTPVVTDPIKSEKSTRPLKITNTSHFSGPAAGDLKMILLCDKINKTDINIKFYEERNGSIYWEKYAEFSPTKVHHQTAIVFSIPPYKNQSIEDPVSVFIQLERPSDGNKSNSVPFQYHPCEDEHESLKRKRRKFNDSQGS